MEERILKFIAALRAGGVRVSLAESADACAAIDRLGVKSRDPFRLGMRATLVKDAANLAVFDELFPLFFGIQEAPLMFNPSQELTLEEAELLAQALQQFNDRLRSMLERLLKGDLLDPDELAQFGHMVGLDQIEDLRYRQWMAGRLQKALQFKQVRDALEALAETLEQMGMDKQRVEQLARMLQANQKALQEQLSQYAGQRIAENMSNRPPEADADGLLDRPFNALSDQDLERLRKEVQRLANALRTRVALRQKHAKTGQLDAKATLRANLKHGSVPVEIRHRDRHLRPKLVVICDVSTSMRSCTELMLSLLYAMQDLIAKMHAFAFIDHLEYISPDLSRRQSEEAVNQVLRRMPSGYYNTDLGFSLENFFDLYLNLMDSRTTFIIVGDGRNNHNNPRLELFRQLARRSRRTVWLNPEPPAMWGAGDSDMLKYAPECDTILQAGTLSELTRAVDQLL